MRLTYWASAAFSLFVLTACETNKPIPDDKAKAPTTADAVKPVPPPEPPPPVPVKVEPPKPVEVAPQKQELDEEANRLQSHQKNLFQVFNVVEKLSGLKPKPNAIGVFELKTFKNGKFRIALNQQPDSPAKLKIGSYAVNLDLAFDYVETKECIVPACAGKRKNIVRSVPKSVQIFISPKTGFAGSKDISLFEGDAGDDAKNYRNSYANLVMAVKKISVATR